MSVSASSYDGNGNLTNDGTRTFVFNVENQLTNVFVAGAWRSDFVYDGLGRRRITRDYSWSGSAWTQTNEIHYVYDGNLVLQERNGSNVVQVTYTRGTDLSGTTQGAGGIGGLLARTDSNGSTFYHADGNGNVTSLTDANENVVARYLYDPFGKLLGLWGTLANANAYRFSSKEFHQNSGLAYYLYRFYDANLQRWPNRDPLGEPGFEVVRRTKPSLVVPFAELQEGPDLYLFVGNAPTTDIDPLGLGLAPGAGIPHGYHPPPPPTAAYQACVANCQNSLRFPLPNPVTSAGTLTGLCFRWLNPATKWPQLLAVPGGCNDGSSLSCYLGCGFANLIPD